MAEEFTTREVAGDHPIGHLLLAAMTDHCGDRNVMEVFSIRTGEPIKVSLIINGVEVSIKPSIKRWTGHMDERIRARARELISDRLRQLEDRLSVFSKKVFEFARIEFPEIYVDEDR